MLVPLRLRANLIELVQNRMQMFRTSALQGDFPIRGRRCDGERAAMGGLGDLDLDPFHLVYLLIDLFERPIVGENPPLVISPSPLSVTTR